MMTRQRSVPAMAIALTLLGAGSHAAEIHVYEGGLIQGAIDSAAVGDEIIVHPGTYTENLDMSGKEITLRSTDPTDPDVVNTTILDGGAVGTVVTCDTNETPATVISGFTITNGSAANGGGMFISNAGPKLLKCTFRGNTADYGGGVFNGSGTPVLVDCTIEHNTANFSGGGMYNYGYPGQASADITNCQFNENTAESSGGGMRNWDSSPMLTECTFYYNHARFNGAGMANGGTSHPVITGSLFRSNRTDTLYGNWDSYGGGMHNAEDARPKLVNCVFQSNSVHALYPWLSHGGAIANLDDAKPEIINCTLIANHANLGNGLFNADAAAPVVTNSILWDSEDELVNQGSAAADIRYSDVLGYWPGPGNINTDPLFVNPEDGDYHLSFASPCINAGHNWGLPADEYDIDYDGKTCEIFPIDLDGNPRFSDDPETADTGCGLPVVVDMGAFEFSGEPAQIIYADANGDGVVDVLDLLGVLTEWGPYDGCSLGDFDINGVVDVLDLLEILSAWGPC